jgi:cytochrome c oxidase subunit 2
MEQLSLFHDHSMIFVSILTVISLYIVFIPIFQKSYNKYCMESQELELFWTVMPSVILLFIALPSIKILYFMEESSNPSVTIKSVGHQWYWSYESSIKVDFTFDRFMESSLVHRLIKNRIAVPVLCSNRTRFLVSSEDVIHSWTVPSIGVKVDALPGRLNQLIMFPKKPGLFFGQCSEICGANHSFIPISLLVRKTFND